MKGTDGFVQGYNAQAAVDPTLLLIVGHGLTQAANDKQQLASRKETPRNQLRQILALRPDQRAFQKALRFNRQNGPVSPETNFTGASESTATEGSSPKIELGKGTRKLMISSHNSATALICPPKLTL